MGHRRVTIAFLIAAAALSAQTHGKKSRKAARIEDPRFDAAVVNASTQPEIEMGQKGAAVLRAQILLDRAGFSPGEIDGEFGSNLGKALGAFFKERQLPPADRIDAAAWAALNADSAPVLTAYTISDGDVKGPYQPVPRDMIEQAKLPALGYSSLLEALGERFHTSPAILKALNPGTSFTKAGQQAMVPNVMTMPPGEAARVVVSKSESSVRAYGADGKLLAFYVATIGSEHDPLPIGEWKIRGVGKNPVFHYNPELFWDAKPNHTKAKIQPGPNNPVGVVWIDLDKEHYGIHGTPEPSRVGHTTSHGCIRLTNWDAAELASMVKPGVPAILQE
jgi:lipoprotein-anchoring transpeptidase ErfK/SrfK